VVSDLPGVELDYDKIGTSTEALAYSQVPERMVVIGAGVIGLELGSVWSRLGSKVFFLEYLDRILAGIDAEIAAEALKIFKKQGLEFRLGARVTGAKKKGNVCVVEVAGDAPIECDRVLLAVGRKPNTHDLGLKEAGIEADERGYIKVDDELRTSAEGVWALGDANGRGAFTHTSYNDYEIVTANLFDGDRRRVSDRIPAYALYIDPPLGRAGMNEAEARKSGKRVLAAKMPMSRVGRAREAGETQGFMKVLVDADSKELLGAALLGLNADEIVHSLLDMMYAKKPYTTIQRAVHIHPTVSELIPTLLGGLKPLK